MMIAAVFRRGRYGPQPSCILSCDTFVAGDGELAPGNLNPLPVEAEQLTCTVSGEMELTLA